MSLPSLQESVLALSMQHLSEYNLTDADVAKVKQDMSADGLKPDHLKAVEMLIKSNATTGARAVDAAFMTKKFPRRALFDLADAKYIEFNRSPRSRHEMVDMWLSPKGYLLGLALRRGDVKAG